MSSLDFFESRKPRADVREYLPTRLALLVKSLIEAICETAREASKSSSHGTSPDSASYPWIDYFRDGSYSSC